MNELEFIKQQLSYSNSYTEMDNRLLGYIEDGKALLGRYCKDLNYQEAGQARMLLLNYVTYALSNGTDDFEENYRRELISLSNRGRIQDSPSNPTVIDELKKQIEQLAQLLESTKTELSEKIDGIDLEPIKTDIKNLQAKDVEFGNDITLLQQSDESTASAIQELGNDITSLQESDQAQTDSITALQAKDTETDKTIEDLKAKDKEQDEAIAQAGTSQEVLDEIEQLKQKDTEQDTALKALQTNDARQDSQIQTDFQRLSDVVDELGLISEGQDANYKDIQALKESDQTQTDSITALQAKDVELGNDISLLQQSDESTASAIQELQTKDSLIDKDIEGLKAKDIDLGNDITTLQESDQTHSDSITALQAKDTETDKAIEDLKAKDVEQDKAIEQAGTSQEVLDEIEQLKKSDQTHSDSITVLQTKDTETDEAIKALQAKDVEQDEAIANAGGSGGIDGGYVDEDGTLHLTYKEEEQATIETPYELATYTVTYYDYDRTRILFTEEVIKGHDATYSEEIPKDYDEYEYTFAGWSKERHGEADPEAQKKIKSDLSLYAAYTTTPKTFTVYFYNGDELLETVENVPYNGTATYPGKTSELVDPFNGGGTFNAWYPRNTNITANTSCYATFKTVWEDVEIEDDWQTIINSINDGSYKGKYKVGNYKSLDLGDEGSINMQIVGFLADDKIDGHGKAKTTWIAKNLLKTPVQFGPKAVSTKETNVKFGKHWIEENDYWKAEPVDGYKTSFIATFEFNESIKETTLSYKMTADCDETLSFAFTNISEKVPGPIRNEPEWKELHLNASSDKNMKIQATYSNPNTREFIRNGTAFIKVSNQSEASVTVNDLTLSSVLKNIENGTGAAGGWEKSSIRDYIHTNIAPLIPSPVSENIVEVFKSSISYQPEKVGNQIMDKQGNTLTKEKVWIPNSTEISSNSYNKPSSTSGFNIKNDQSDKAQSWWLRNTNNILTTTDGDGTVFYMSTSGAVSKTTNPTYSYYICIGFCL